MQDLDSVTLLTFSDKDIYDYVFIPNRTFLVRFGGISGEFGRAMVRILARRSRAKIPMARPNEPDVPPKRTKKVRLGIYRTPIQPIKSTRRASCRVAREENNTSQQTAPKVMNELNDFILSFIQRAK